MTDLFEKSIETLELPRVLDLLADQAVTQEGKSGPAACGRRPIWRRWPSG